MQNPPSPRLRAFTLIELLVVIAIIALLAAILFPVFSRARENARRSSCLNNMKNLGTAIMMYATDYDEMLPYEEYAWNTTGKNHWDKMVFPYVKNVQVFQCPSGTGQQINVENGTDWPAKPNRDYAMNDWLCGTAVTATKRLKLPQIQNTADIFLIGEGLRTNLGGWYSAIQYGTTAGGGAFVRPNAHLEGSTFMYCDGHAKWLPSYTSLKPFSATMNVPSPPWWPG